MYFDIDEGDLIEGSLHSVESEEQFQARFVNTTDRSVEVIWLDFTGQPVTYKILQPDELWVVDTYKVF